MKLRTLMVGCVAGQGAIGILRGRPTRAEVDALRCAIVQSAKQLKSSLVVFKEFSGAERNLLSGLVDGGFTRVPSFPSVALSIAYRDFEDYLRRGVTRNMRSHLRRKYRALQNAAPIDMTVTSDVSDIIDDLYPLYLQVYDRSDLHFERLTKDFFREIGRRMPDKVRFFVWRQSGKPIAFSLSLVTNGTIYNEYLGLDYRVALKLHMYFVAFRDILTWAIENGYKQCVSTSLCYDPKLHLGFRLAPLDLYAMHTNPVANRILGWAMPFLEPTRYDPVLPKFSNYRELWGNDDASAVRGISSEPAISVSSGQKHRG